jgi:hypothetical protein
MRCRRNACRAIWRSTQGEFSEDTIRTYQRLAGNLIQQGNLSEAQEFAEAGTRAYEGVRVRLAHGGLQRSLFTARQVSYQILAALRAERGDPVGAWHAAEADLARGLLDAAAASRGDNSTASERKSQAELARRLNDLDPLISRIATLAR